MQSHWKIFHRERNLITSMQIFRWRGWFRKKINEGRHEAFDSTMYLWHCCDRGNCVNWQCDCQAYFNAPRRFRRSFFFTQFFIFLTKSTPRNEQIVRVYLENQETDSFTKYFSDSFFFFFFFSNSPPSFLPRWVFFRGNIYVNWRLYFFENLFFRVFFSWQIWGGSSDFKR